jgi:hypothetical protein
MNIIPKTSERDIRRKWSHEYRLNDCLAYYIELHENGHFDAVARFLKNGDAFLGHQGYTWENALAKVCTIQTKDFHDGRGEYAGTFYTYVYNNQEVYSSTSYSLFN